MHYIPRVIENIAFELNQCFSIAQNKPTESTEFAKQMVANL